MLAFFCLIPLALCLFNIITATTLLLMIMELAMLECFLLLCSIVVSILVPILGIFLGAFAFAIEDTVRTGNAIFYRSFLHAENHNIFQEQLDTMIKFISLSPQDERLLIENREHYVHNLTPQRKAQLLAHCQRTGSHGFAERLTDCIEETINNRPYIFNADTLCRFNAIKEDAKQLKNQQSVSQGIKRAARKAHSLDDVEKLQTTAPRKNLNHTLNNLLLFTRSILAYESPQPDQDALVKEAALNLENQVQSLQFLMRG
jgi:hypothetical protein